MNEVNLLIGGDTCPFGVNEGLFAVADKPALLGDLQGVIENSDLFIINLECPLTRSIDARPKIGPNLKADPATAIGIRGLGVDIACLANNHMMDFGEDGLFSTMRALEEIKVSTIGAGRNIGEAIKFEIRDFGGLRIAVAAMAEREFGIATHSSAGVSPIDYRGFLTAIRAHRADYDHLVVLIHGGNEHYRLPRPGLVETARLLVSLGASAVICQHTHVIGCYEWFEGAPIVYGQGNFLFDYDTDRSSWDEGALVKLIFDEQGCSEIEFVPFRQHREGARLRAIGGKEKARILSEIEDRSSILGDVAALEREWSEYCRSVERFYLHTLHRRSGLFRRAVGKLGKIRLLEGKTRSRARLNLIRCESHNEVLQTLLSEIQD